MPNITPPPAADPAGTRPARFARWRRLLPRLRAGPLFRTLGISISAAALVVLVWLWHGASDAPGSRAEAASPAPPPSADGFARPVADRPEIIFNWQDAAGVPHRAAVPRDDYLAYLASARAAVERDRQAATAAATQELGDRIVPVFDQMQARVSQYADWAFDWWTAWILLGRSFAWTWDDLRRGYFLALPDRVQAQLTGAIRDRFRDLALRPEVTDPQLTEIVAHSWAAAGAVLMRNCADAQVALADLVKRSARRAERRDPPQGWLPDPSWNAASATFQSICVSNPPIPLNKTEIGAASAVSDASAAVDEVILRLARPFATKLISFIVLPGIIAAIVGGFVLPLFGLLPNVISGIVTGILTGAFGAMLIGFAASASVDMLLNRTDEALNRPQFEASARKAVIAVQADFERRVLSAEQKGIADAANSLLATVAGEAAKR